MLSMLLFHVTECRLISWIWGWMWALISISSVEVVVSIVALVLYLLVHSHKIVGTKLNLALKLIPEITTLVRLFIS